MITCVVYSESGGTYKTTTTANLGVAFQRMGLETLLIDLDPQTGNLSGLFNVGANRGDKDADNLVKHILERPDGDFEDLIETTDEGVDIIPGHDMLGDFTSNLEQKITYETGMDGIERDEYPRYELLYKLLWEKQGLNEKYDAILIDPNARAEDLLYNAIYALRTLVAPVKPAGKGNLSLEGLDELVRNLESTLDISVGLSCVVPTKVTRNNAHQVYSKQFEDKENYSTPVVIADRESMMDAMWEAHGSAFKVVEERWKTEAEGEEAVSKPGRRRIREREVETLRDIFTLAEFIATDTFGEDVVPVTELSIQGMENQLIDLKADDGGEVTVE